MPHAQEQERAFKRAPVGFKTTRVCLAVVPSIAESIKWTSFSSDRFTHRHAGRGPRGACGEKLFLETAPGRDASV